MAVPNTFASATSAIPLANLDANFAYYDAGFSLTGSAVTFAGAITLTSGTANGVPYLNASKVLTSGAALTFNGTVLTSSFAGPVAATTLSASSTVSGAGFSTYLASPPAIGGTLAAAITGTTITANTGFAGPLNGTVGATTANTGAFTTLSTTSAVTITGGTANGVAYLDGSKVLTSGTALTFDGSNLGLGVTPSAWSLGKALEVNAVGNGLWTVGNANIYLVSNTYYASGAYRYASTNPASAYEQDNSVHKWRIAPSGTAGNAITFTQAMTLTADGNLLVGTTNLTFSSGGIRLYANNSLEVVRDGASNQANVYLNKISNDGEIVSFNRAGTQVGNISVTTLLTTYNTTSDYRLKTVIGAVADSGSRIDALQPVEYTWNTDGSRTRGFLAHQFQEVYAGSVTGTKDAVDVDGKPVYQAMQAATSEVIADLVAEIQDLRKRLAALEAA